MSGRAAALLPPSMRMLLVLDEPGAVADLAPAVDWARVEDAAAAHRLTARLATAVARAGDVAPDEVGRRAHRWQQQLRAQHHMAVRPQLDRLVDGLAGHGLRPVLLKGASLTTTGVVAAEERPLADIDLLARPEDLPDARRALARLGYTSGVSEEHRAWARQHHYHDPPLRHPDHPLPVELHRGLLHPRHRRRFDHRSLGFRPCEGLPAADRLDDVDELVHLCLHFLHDRELGRPGALGQLYDVAAAAARLEGDGWRELGDRGARRGHLDALAATIALLDVLLARPVPRELPRAVQLVEDPRLTDFAVHRVVTSRPPYLQLLMVTPDVAYRWPRIGRRVAGHLQTAVTRPRGDGLRPTDVTGSLRDLARRPRRTLAEMRIDRWAHDL